MRVRADQHLSRRRRPLQARSHVDGITDDLLDGERLTRGRVRDHDLAGVDADPNLQADAPSLLELIVQKVQRGPISAAARTALSASSSCSAGIPKTAITASPMNFAAVPPWRSTVWLISS